MKQLYLNEVLVDIGDDTVIEMVFQINDLGELKNRQSNYSKVFSIPMTARNREIFDSAEVMATITQKPYIKVPARIYDNGVETLKGYAVLEQSNDVYQITFSSGNKSFYDTITGKSIRDLDLSSFNHVWNLDTVLVSVMETQGYTYPLVDLGNALIYERKADVRYLTPWIFIHTIVEQIFLEAGWTASGAFLSSDAYLSMIISVTGMDILPEFLLAKATTSTDHLDEFGPGANNYVIFDTENNDPTETFFINAFGSGNIKQNSGAYTSYMAYVTGKYSFVITIIYETDASTGYISVFGPGGTPIEIHHEILPASTSNTVVIKINNVTMNAGEAIQVFAQSDDVIAFPMTVKAGSTLECVEASGTIEFGKLFTISNNLPDITQVDFLKAIFQMACITIDADDEAKILYLKTFSEIVENKQFSKDWSDKMNVSSPATITYHANNYAQKNWMRYKPEEGVPENLGDGYIEIADESLAETKDLFTLPFAASQMVYRFNGLQVPEYLRIDGADVKPGKPRILFVIRGVTLDEPITYTDGTYSAVNSDTENLAYFIDTTKQYSIGFNTNLVELYYSELQTVLNNFRQLTAQFHLEQTDISNLDMFIPVFLRKYGNNFYVNKIDGWVPGLLSTVTLIKI